MFYGIIGTEFHRVSRATSKIQDFSHTCKELLSWNVKTKWADKEN